MTDPVTWDVLRDLAGVRVDQGRATLAHGGSVCVIRRERDLDPVEGIAALLRF